MRTLCRSPTSTRQAVAKPSATDIICTMRLLDPRLVLTAMLGIVSLLSLSGCGAQVADVDDIRYEVTTSAPGGHVQYGVTVGGIEPVGQLEDLTNTTWSATPELNLGTTTPSVIVTPPPGGQATCQIVGITNGASVTLDQDAPGTDVEAECHFTARSN